MEAKPWFKFWPVGVRTSLEYPEIALYELLATNVKRQPNSVALWYRDAALTYGQLDEYSDTFAAWLFREGVGKNYRVALFLPNLPAFVICFFGVLKTGATAVPCNILYKPRELLFQLEDSGAEILVAATNVIRDLDLYASVREIREKTHLRKVVTCSVTDFLPSSKRLLAPLVGVKNPHYPNTVKLVSILKQKISKRTGPDIEPRRDIAVLQYTGGTTGVAKGAMLTHYNLLSNAVMTANWLPIKGEDHCLGVLPFFHIYGLTVSLLAPFVVGAKISLTPRFEVEAVLQTIQGKKITIFCGVPTMYIALINHPRVSDYDLSSVRGCISGAAPLPLAVMNGFNKIIGGKLGEGYGLSEASPVTHCNPLDSIEKMKAGSIGIPFPDTDAKIFDLENGTKELSPGEVGELAVKGPQVMLGYWNRPEETRFALRDGWLFTGDIAKMDEDGYFFIVDRKKDMIDAGGFKVWPREVEEVLYEHPAIKEATVVGVSDPYRGETVKAYVVLKENHKGAVKSDEIIEFCKGRIASYKTPKIVEIRDELPKTLVGKILKRILRDEQTPTKA